MRRSSFLLPLVMAVTALPPAQPASAQSILVRVTGGQPVAPLQGALVYLDDVRGPTIQSRLSDDVGRALFVGVPPGRYRVRAEMIGMATAETGPFEVATGTSVPIDLPMESSAIVVEGIDVEADERCRVRPEEGLLVARVWDEARKALSAAAFTDRQELYRYETMRYQRELEMESKTILREDRSRRGGYMRTPFESRPAEDLAENGYVQDTPEGIYYFAPDADVLLSDVFLDSHCFRLVAGSGDAAGLVGLGFEPTGNRRGVADIAGTLWVDPETSELRWLEFVYEHLDPDVRSSDLGGYVEFQRMPEGTWIVPEWWIRMPRLVRGRDFQGAQRSVLDGFREVGGLVLDVRAGGRTLAGKQTGGIEGLVLDSLGVRPVPQASVGVVGSNQQVFTDADGRFTIPGLAEGTYRVRFAHPSLEDFGYVTEPIVQEVFGGEMAQVEYRMASVGDALFELCRGEARPEDSVVVAGAVRDTRNNRPISGAVVRVEWQTVRMADVHTEDARITGTDQHGFQTTTDAEGRYRFCAVPEDRTISLTALHDGYGMEPDSVWLDRFVGAITHELLLTAVRR
jgi:hypothetical protein